QLTLAETIGDRGAVKELSNVGQSLRSVKVTLAHPIIPRKFFPELGTETVHRIEAPLHLLGAKTGGLKGNTLLGHHTLDLVEPTPCYLVFLLVSNHNLLRLAYDAHNTLLLSGVAALAKQGRKDEFVPVLVEDAGPLPEVRIEFDVVDKPHRELGLAGASIPPPLRRIPCPAAMPIERVQIAFQETRRHVQAVTDEVAVDIVRMVLGLHERTVDEDRIEADTTQLCY